MLIAGDVADGSTLRVELRDGELSVAVELPTIEAEPYRESEPAC